MRACLYPFVSLLVARTALAATGGAPVTLQQSGYVLGADDGPLDATVNATFSVRLSATGSEPAEWQATCPITIANGYYAVTLGTGACAGSSALETSDLPSTAVRWLELALDGVTLLPRLPLASVPAAALASDALALGGRPAADYVTVDGTGKLAASVLPAAGGDLSGGLATASVVALRGRALSANAPANGQVLTFDAVTQAWLPKSPPAVPGGGQGPVTLTAVLDTPCTVIGQLATDAAGNLMVCDDTPSVLTTSDCSQLGPGAQTYDANGGLYVCAN